MFVTKEYGKLKESKKAKGGEVKKMEERMIQVTLIWPLRMSYPSERPQQETGH